MSTIQPSRQDPDFYQKLQELQKSSAANLALIRELYRSVQSARAPTEQTTDTVTAVDTTRASADDTDAMSIECMWDGFSADACVVEDSQFDEEETPRRKSKSPRKTKGRCTTPKEFSFHNRERQQTTSERRMMVRMVCVHNQPLTRDSQEDLIKKQAEEDAHLRVRIRARPVPASTIVPRYHRIVAQNESRRLATAQKRAKELQTSMKPFRLHDKKQTIHQQRITPGKFRANEVPYDILDPDISEQMKEQELYRKIRIKMRASAMLREAALPPRMQKAKMYQTISS